jgi:hypothetical protein
MRRAAFALAIVLSFDAHADAAFPTGMTVLLPALAPSRILVGTTFGLVVSEDDGATWRYACEPFVTGSGSSVFVYQLVADGAVLAVHADGLSRSGDVGCSWTQATGTAGLTMVDAFATPGNAASVLAIGWPSAGAELLPSTDGGRSFGAPLLASGTSVLHDDERLVSLEIAASDPNVVYATTFAFATASSPGGVALLRSNDGGNDWTRFDVAVPAGAQVKIAQVDPADANTVYFLVSSATSDELRVTSNGGSTIQPLLAPGSTIGGFVRASDGTLFAGTSDGDFYVRAPGGAFQRSAGPHLRCLGERAGRVYACGDSTRDGYDLASTDDGGKSFQKRLVFSEIAGPLTCPAVQTACAADFANLQRTLALAPVANCSCGGGSAGVAALLIVIVTIVRTRRRALAPDRQ